MPALAERSCQSQASIPFLRLSILLGFTPINSAIPRLDLGLDALALAWLDFGPDTLALTLLLLLLLLLLPWFSPPPLPPPPPPPLVFRQCFSSKELQRGFGFLASHQKMAGTLFCIIVIVN
jgi:hypothetical protein